MVTPKQVEEILTQVVKDNGLEGAVVADSEGLPIASYIVGDYDEDDIAAASAAILLISDSKLREAGKGSIKQASIEGQDGYMVVAPLGEEFVLTVIAPKNSKLGIVLAAVRSINRKLNL
ncbi:roadblock/LC7 domain-containing protein [Thermovibrio ammonificans]|uniref:Roadblock/LC7 family protein n=1 Tax=Thermovibrio ammonificans (strain DSM 15698 / JCM 12110 / HB-1) TaxID=648996 RepID=E8T3F9_THEA1|nr:roadblock/LC7 domain-containing protein [Thermovibrio ammonificans]ADU96090.1 Roadblock/LC7 family protein [Thermovibrio ammonificans HB-1]